VNGKYWPSPDLHNAKRNVWNMIASQTFAQQVEIGRNL
jgi:hypothetical protein